MTIVVNGTARELAEPMTVAEVVAAFTAAPPGGTGVAVAVNDAVVGRARWADTVLANHDRVEILTAVQGG